MAGCPTRDVLTDFAAGRLADTDIDTIGLHLDRCSHCRDTLESSLWQLLSDPIAAGLYGRARTDPYCAEPGLAAAHAAVGGFDPLGSIDNTKSYFPGRSHQRPEFAPPPEGVDAIGQLGPYLVVRELGSGGMGLVYEATDSRLQRRVALKVMRPHLAADPAATLRFIREARAAAQLVNDRAAAIYDVGEADGIPFLAMEFLEGETLGQCLRREKTLAVEQVVALGIEIAEGLAAAHDHGLIHRDIKPDNIWLLGLRHDEPALRVKLLDFGLARSIVGDSQITQSGTIVGTPAYMAPEQARSESPVDHRCDLFALGCVLYRASTGAVPFPGRDTFSTLLSLATRDPTPPHRINAQISPRLSSLILRLLAKEPSARLASAAAVAASLRTIHEPVRNRHRQLALAAVAVFVLGIAVVAASVGRSPPLPEVAADAPASQPPPAVMMTAIVPPPATSTGFALDLDQGCGVEVPGFQMPSDGPLTLEAWVAIAPATEGIACQFMGTNSIAQIGRKEGRWFGYLFHGDLDDPERLVPHKWTHLAVVRTADANEFYVDGRRVARNRNAGIPDSELERDFRIGHTDFVGCVDEIRVSAFPRYSSDFTPAARFEPDEHTLALYHCDEGSGNRLIDSSRYGRHGTAVQPKWRTGNAPAASVSGSEFALKFQHDSSAVVPGLSFAGLQELTIEFYCTADEAVYAASTHLMGVPRQCSLFVQQGGRLWGFGTRVTGNFYSISTAVPPRGRRVHVAGVIRPKQTRIYIDGKIAAESGNAGGIIIESELPFNIGPNFVGTVDEIRLSRCARYENDFAPRPRFEPDPDTLALYHCDEGRGTALVDSSGNERHGTLSRTDWVHSAP